MRPVAAALALALALPLPSMAGEVKVQPGETLSEIADRLGVSMKRLMEVNNISDPDHVEAGTSLRLPSGARASSGPSGSSGGGTTVTVGEGETLSDIANRHGISMSALIALNSLSDPNHLEAGQVLKLRGIPRASASTPRTTAKPASFSYTPGATAHVVRKGESLSAISRGTGVPISQLVALNALSDPNNVPAGSTLRLIGPPAATASPAPRPRTETRPAAAVTPRSQPAQTVAAAPRPAVAATQGAAKGKSDWRTYGPQQVDWSSWQPMGGSMVAAVVNAKGESLYTSVNCGARKINSTDANGQWGSWKDPSSEVETRLVNDYCSRRGA
ncbi:MAG: LysM peptidoglycan-binding domain-containing protein [Cyanobacteriota bacterium]|nr:LysM peptidoglycan-binding domain-containing protein [Cyanobacteriota bacterium]